MFQLNLVKFSFFQKPLNKSSFPQELDGGPFDEIPARVFYNICHTDTATRIDVHNTYVL